MLKMGNKMENTGQVMHSSDFFNSSSTHQTCPHSEKYILSATSSLLSQLNINSFHSCCLSCWAFPAGFIFILKHLNMHGVFSDKQSLHCPSESWKPSPFWCSIALSLPKSLLSIFKGITIDQKHDWSSHVNTAHLVLTSLYNGFQL